MIDGYLTATRSPRRLKAAAWVVLSAVLLNLVSGYVLPSSAQAALTADGVLAGPSSGAVVICTPNGLRVTRLGPDGVPLPDQTHYDANCIYCLPFSIGQAGVLGAQTIEMIPLSMTVRITYPAYSQTSSSSGSLDSHPIWASQAD